MKTAIERNDPVAIGRAGFIMIAAHEFDARLHRLGARGAKKHRVSKGRSHKPRRKLFELRRDELIRTMPQGGTLSRKFFNQIGVTMAECVYSDACCKIEIGLTVITNQIHPLASRNANAGAAINR